METSRFDDWVSAIASDARSRRGLLRLGLGAGLAGLGLRLGVEPALACRRNGKPCGSGRNGGCCSGTCRKGTCRPAKGAAGCTIRLNACQSTPPPCPNNPAGFCVVLDNGTPFCAVTSRCLDCESDADCAIASGGTPGKCVKDCPACLVVNLSGRSCVYRTPLG